MCVALWPVQLMNISFAYYDINIEMVPLRTFGFSFT